MREHAVTLAVEIRRFRLHVPPMPPSSVCPPGPAGCFNRRSLILAAGAGLALAALRAHAAPEAPAAIDVTDFDWVDTARQRAVPARLYWPVGVPASQRLPLVVFSHGLGGSRFGYSHFGRHWAAQGFASLHVQHAGSDRAVWTSGVLDLLGNLNAAASDANAIARAQDVSFGIGALLADPVASRRIDASRIAVAGHSYGANTAMLVAGATVAREVDGQWRDLSFRDPRVKAAVLLSAPPFYGEGDMRTILAGVAVPTLHVTGTEDVIRVPGFRSDPSDRVAVYDAMPKGPGAAPKWLAVFTGGTHSIFTDRTDRAGWELNQTVKGATRELTTEFFRAVLQGAPAERVTAWLELRRELLTQKAAWPARP
jgi:predicted dienelactone hydrolase